MNELYTVSDAAKLLGIEPRSVRYARKRAGVGRLMGGQWLLTADEIEQLRDRGRPGVYERPKPPPGPEVAWVIHAGRTIVGASIDKASAEALSRALDTGTRQISVKRVKLAALSDRARKHVLGILVAEASLRANPEAFDG